MKSAICRVTKKEFFISDLEEELCSKLDVPYPTLSPLERMRQLTAFNNYLNLYPGVCSATGVRMISMFRPNMPFPVYAPSYWWSDNWSATDFGRDYNLNSSFLSQFSELQKIVPICALSTNFATLENCEYVNGCSYSKNCYLCFLCTNSNDCLFCFNIRRCQDCIDCDSAYDCELCYECVFVSGSYNLQHSINCRNCVDSYFLNDCVGCTNCFGCSGLRQAKYCFFNEQLTQSEYESQLQEINFGDSQIVDYWGEKTSIFFRTVAPLNDNNLNCEDVTGNYLLNCKNLSHCFHCSQTEDSANCLLVDSANDCMDLYTWGASAELIYCCSRSGTNAYKNKFCFLVYAGSRELEYCMCCIGCTDCFGCIGLKHKKFHILNKEYSESEYRTLRTKIINRMSSKETPEEERYGEFFPYNLSFFPYNDSDAMLFFPENKEKAADLGAKWGEEAEGKTMLLKSWEEIPSDILKVDKSVCDSAFVCEKTGKPHKITPQEFNIYKKRLYPLPRVSWLERIRKRQHLVKIVAA